MALIPDDAIDPALVRYAAVWKPQPGVLRGISQARGDLQSRRRRRRRARRSDAAGRAARARRGRRPHHAHDRIRRAACADASPPAGLRRAEPARARLGAEAAMRPRATCASASWASACSAATRPRCCARLGFDVAGWSRTREIDSGRRDASCGRGGLDAFLARTEILVCLLPLTPQTRGILNRETFAQARARRHARRPGRDQCGARRLQVEADILVGARRRHARRRDARRVRAPSRCRRTARSGRIRR